MNRGPGDSDFHRKRLCVQHAESDYSEVFMEEEEAFEAKEWIEKMKQSKPEALILHEAARAGRADVILWIMQHGNENERDLNGRDSQGDTPLHVAAEYDKLAIVALLWNFPNGQRPDVNAKNKSGFTALDLASLYENFVVIQLLSAFLERPCFDDTSIFEQPDLLTVVDDWNLEDKRAGYYPSTNHTPQGSPSAESSVMSSLRLSL